LQTWGQTETRLSNGCNFPLADVERSTKAFCALLDPRMDFPDRLVYLKLE